MNQTSPERALLINERKNEMKNKNFKLYGPLKKKKKTNQGVTQI